MAFNFITSKDGRWGTKEMVYLLQTHNGIPCVPIVDDNFILPDTVEELREWVQGETCLGHRLREGVVFRNPDGSTSFKCVDPEYLMKYH